MSGFGGQVLSHVVRRSVEQYPGMIEGDFSQMSPPPEFNLELSNGTMFALISIAVLTVFIIASVDYTVGSVIAALTMIESPSTTTIVESAPPAYSDEPDAPLEKKRYEAVEIVVVEHKPVTARIITAIKHLHAVGGFFARWRGLFQNALYHIGLNILGHIFGGFFALAFGHFGGQCIGYIVATIATCRLRMLWTHSMIAMPTGTRWYKRFVPRKQCKALILPSAVYGIARQMTLLVPITVAHLMGLDALSNEHTPETIKHMTGFDIAMVILRVSAVPISALLVVLFVYLPAEATLTRVEACLLPADQETIVPFDREAIMGEIDMTQRCATKQLFKSAWKSFNTAARLRLVKLYVKLAAYQFAVALVGVHLIIGVLYLTSREQMVNTIKMVVV